MAKLTKAQRASIERALYHANRANAYIMAPDLALCRRERFATTTLHYTRGDGAILYEVAKHSSHLVGLPDAIRDLERILAD